MASSLLTLMTAASPLQNRNSVPLTPKQLQQIGGALLVVLLLFVGERHNTVLLSHAHQDTWHDSSCSSVVLRLVALLLCVCTGVSFYSSGPRLQKGSLSKCSDRLAAVGLELSHGETSIARGAPAASLALVQWVQVLTRSQRRERHWLQHTSCMSSTT